MPKVIGKGGVYPREDKPKSRCRTWQIRFTVEDEVTKKRSSATEMFAGKYTDAEKRKEAFRKEIETVGIIKGDITFDELCDIWLDMREKSTKLSKRTVEGDRNKLKNARMHLGSTKVCKLDAASINGLYAKLANGESISGKKLKSKSILNIHKSLIPVLKYAIKKQLLPMGVLDDIMRPADDTAERVPLTESEVRDVLKKLKPTSAMHMLVLVYVTCGFRRSEALALDRRDYDEDGLHIRKNTEEDGSLKARPKTKRSSRCVPPPEQTKALLNQWLEHQEILLRNHDIDVLGTTPLFSATGIRYKPHSVTAWWRKHRQKDFGVCCTLHDLRHTFETMLARRGVGIRTAQELVGDETLDVLLGIYTHVSTEDKRNAMETLDNLF